MPQIKDMLDIRMVIGLGNPGKEYADTRHNIGFRVIDRLAETLGIEVRKRKFGARSGLGEFRDKKLILLKPWQFMNRSGQAVATAAGFYRLDPEQLLIISDDMALEPGQIRIRAKGSAGGHNGLVDVLEKLGTENVARLRIGIGSCGSVDAYDYVLDKPAESEKPLIDEAVIKAGQAVVCWLQEGIDSAMNQFNTKVDSSES